jgi:hypothetical protein
MASSYLGSPDFTKHSENLVAVRKGLVQVERLHKQTIRAGASEATSTIARLHGLQIGLVAEAAIRKIVADPNGFNDRERVYLRNARSRIEMWRVAIELAFRHHFSVPLRLEIDAQTTNATTAAQFSTLLDLINNDLAPVIEDRNKVAHAQWAWHLNSKEKGFTGPASAPLNYSALYSRSRLIDAIGQIVNVLTLSGVTFQRDYNDLINKVQQAQLGLDGGSYQKFVKDLLAKSKSCNT